MILLDSCAVIAFLMGEAGAQEVQKEIMSDVCCIHSINYMEIYLDLIRRQTPEKSLQIETDLKELFNENGIRVMKDMPIAIAKKAALRKHEVTQVRDESGKKRTISWADCFVYAYAEEKGLSLVTGDKEFEYLQSLHPNVAVRFFKQPGTR